MSKFILFPHPPHPRNWQLKRQTRSRMSESIYFLFSCYYKAGHLPSPNDWCPSIHNREHMQYSRQGLFTGVPQEHKLSLVALDLKIFPAAGLPHRSFEPFLCKLSVDFEQFSLVFVVEQQGEG